MTTFTASLIGGNWNSGATWDQAGATPTAADDVQLLSTSGAVTINVNAACRSLDCIGISAYTNTLTHNAGVSLTIGDGTAGTGSRALRFSSGMTYTKGNATTSQTIFASTSGTQQTVTLNGKTLGDTTFNGAGGSWLLSDTFSCGAAALAVSNTGSALAANNVNVTCGTLGVSASSIISFGSGTWTISGTLNAINVTAGATVTAGTSTIALTDASGSAKGVAGGGCTFGNLTITGGGAGAVVFETDATFGTITATGPKTLLVTKTKTLTASSLVISGTAGNIVTLDTEDGAGTFTISCSSAVSLDYLSVTRSVAAGTVPFYAGTHSTDGGTNTNWTFTGPPAPVLSAKLPKQIGTQAVKRASYY